MFDENGNLIVLTLKEIQELYKAKYEESFGIVDVEPTSALGTDLAITAEMKKISNETMQEALSQNNPYTATGLGLENICYPRGIFRKIDEHSIVFVTFSGLDGVVIESGTIVKHNTTNEEFQTTEKGIISGGVFSVFAVAIVAGRIACGVNTITLTDIVDVTVTNSNSGILGYLLESDTDLRKRLLALRSSLSVDDKLEQELLNISDVKAVDIVANKELVPDENGISPKSTSIIVLGGESKEIAKKIYTFIPADKKTIGSTQEAVSSEVNQKDYYVYFSRPTQVSIDVVVTLSVDSTFNDGDIGAIRESILSFFSDRFKIFDEVVTSLLYLPSQQDYNENNLLFKGVTDCNITLNGTVDNVLIAYNEFPVLNAENLTVTTV